MAKLTLQELESYLWELANILRESIDLSDYKNYIYGLLFLNRLNGVFVLNTILHEERNGAIGGCL